MRAIVVGSRPCRAPASTPPLSRRSRWFSATTARGRPWRPGGSRSPPRAIVPSACAPPSAIAEVRGQGDVDQLRVERLDALLAAALEALADEPDKGAGGRLLLGRRGGGRGRRPRPRGPPRGHLRPDRAERRRKASAQPRPAGLRLDQAKPRPVRI